MQPDNYTIREFYLNVTHGHQLFVREWGNADAKTLVIFLHGGPGSGCKNKHRSSFDPKRHHVIFFDQRGAGQSLPYGSLNHNTTHDLVEDISAVADHFGHKKIVLAGGSWGATLALCYAIAHPERVQALVISSIWTATKAEVQWLVNGAFKPFYPEVWEKYVKATPRAHRADPSAYHIKRILGEDADDVMESAYAYESLEGGIISLDDQFEPPARATYDPTSIRIEVHYTANRCFMAEGHILQHAQKLEMPIWLIHGRYDMVCPPTTAHELHKKLPNSELVWTIGGHRAEHETRSVMRGVMAQFS